MEPLRSDQDSLSGEAIEKQIADFDDNVAEGRGADRPSEAPDLPAGASNKAAWWRRGGPGAGKCTTDQSHTDDLDHA